MKDERSEPFKAKFMYALCEDGLRFALLRGGPRFEHPQLEWSCEIPKRYEEMFLTYKK